MLHINSAFSYSALSIYLQITIFGSVLFNSKIAMQVNPLNVIALLNAIFSGYNLKQSSPNTAEMDLANSISRIIFEAMEDPRFIVEENVYLDFSSSSDTPVTYAIDTSLPEEDDMYGNIEEIEMTGDTHQSDDNSFNDPEDSCSKDAEEITLDYKKDAVAFWKSAKTKRTLESIQHRFRKVKSMKQLRRWEAQLQSGGSRMIKLHKISEYVLNKFNDALKRRKIIKDFNLKKWALEEATKVQLSGFQASDSWLLR